MLARGTLAAGRSLRGRIAAAPLWALLGALGFAVSGGALLADVLERPVVLAEVTAVAAVALWWLAASRGFRRRRGFAFFSLLAAACAAGAILGQLVWEPPAGAVPVRFAYVLWGPWGLWLGGILAR